MKRHRRALLREERTKMPRAQTLDLLAELSNVLMNINEEGKVKLLDYADVLVKCGRYAPGTVRMEWARNSIGRRV